MKKTTDSAAPSPPIKRSRASLAISLISLGFLLMTGLLVLVFWDYIREPELLRDAIGEHYVLGAICLVLISAVQAIVALVPGEFVEIAAGYMFGGVWGTILCLGGIVLGSCVAILLVRRFGRRFVYVFYPKEKMDALPILNDPKKRNILTFILFVIPGTPKDLFTYAIGLTDMSIPLYIALTTAARFPSVILSTLSGDAVGTRNYKGAIIFLVVTAIVSGIGLLIYNYISKRHKAQNAAGTENTPTSDPAQTPDA